MKREDRHPYLAAGLTAFAVIAASLLLFFLLFHLKTVTAFLNTIGGILRPIFMGAVIAFLLLPIHRTILTFLLAITPDKRMEERNSHAFLSFVAIVLSLLLALFLIYLLLAMVVPQVYESVVGLVQAIPDYIEVVQGWLQTYFEDNPEIQSAVMSIYNSSAASLEQWLNSDILPNLESATSALEWLRKDIVPNLTGVVAGVSGVVVGFLVLVKDLLIAVIVSVYLLARKDTFAAQSKKIVYSIFPTSFADLVVEEVRSAYKIMSGFINGKLLDSLIIGILCLVCCNIFKFPYPALISVVIGVTNIIPFFGPFIGAIPCGLLIFLISPLQAVYFAIFILVLQQFDGNILGPKILGDSTGLASFWVLFSILLFGGLFGFGGMVLGVPVFAMIYSIIRRMVARGLHSRGLPVETKKYMGKTGPMA
ncbi:AI-2E family transporter [Colidextribacter sp. OB.20]|uniref:AI-2E family transporter n=1 Tax=Colidextribacter sp. OB.20 TaxID=2304568 RepID=UPI00136CDFEB|nr:AI-2E family transporter [Colidextribacter sp. OB.20]NBI08606.1 AI-2E family transporter [Colidextribacter sp. OB.20]